MIGEVGWDLIPIYLLSSPLFLFFNFTDGRAGVRSHYILNFSSLFLFLKFNDGWAGVRSQFSFIFYPLFLFLKFTDFFGSPQTVMLLSIYCYLIPMFNSQQSLLFNVFQQLLLSIQIAFSFSTKHSFPSWFILFSIFPCHLPPLYYTDCWLTSNSYATIHSLKSHPNFQFSAIPAFLCISSILVFNSYFLFLKLAFSQVGYQYQGGQAQHTSEQQGQVKDQHLQQGKEREGQFTQGLGWEHFYSSSNGPSS